MFFFCASTSQNEKDFIICSLNFKTIFVFKTSYYSRNSEIPYRIQIFELTGFAMHKVLKHSNKNRIKSPIIDLLTIPIKHLNT